MLDPAVIENLRELERDGSPGLLRDLVTLFREKTPKAIAELELAVAARDASRIQRCAHNLKSSCGNLGAVELSRLGAELMQESSHFAAAASLLEAFRREYLAVERELEAAIK